MKRISTKSFSFSSGGEILTGDEMRLCGEARAQDDQRFHVLVLHGAGKSTRRRMQNLRETLAARSIPSVAIDFSGHGASSGHLDNSSLKKRVAEALDAILSTTLSEPLTLIVSSMSGHIGIKLMEHVAVKNLIMFCPAIYARAAYDVGFGDGFSRIIRRSNSWQDSDAFEILARFTGNILIFIGTDDTVIPDSVIEKLDECAQKAQSKEIVWLPGAPHLIHDWLIENPETADAVASKIASNILAS